MHYPKEAEFQSEKIYDEEEMKRNKFKRKINFIIDIIIFILIYFMVYYGWQKLELRLMGYINPNKIDTIIGIILTFSLYGNYKKYIKNLFKKRFLF